MVTSSGSASAGGMKSASGIIAAGECRAQARDVEPLGEQVVAQVIALRRVRGRIELDQHVAGLDRLPVLHPNGAHHPGLERLNDLGATARQIFPVADATMSIVPHQAQTSAAQNTRMMVAPIARPIGDGGVSTISSAAGRNASSSPRLWCGRPKRDDALHGLGGHAGSADFMESRLQPMQRCVATAGLDQRVMAAVLDQAAALERDDAIRRPHGREPMRDDQHRPPVGDLPSCSAE